MLNFPTCYCAYPLDVSECALWICCISPLLLPCLKFNPCFADWDKTSSFIAISVLRQMQTGAISKLLYGFACVQAIIHSLNLVDYLPVQTHKPYLVFECIFSQGYYCSQDFYCVSPGWTCCFMDSILLLVVLNWGNMCVSYVGLW